MRSESESPWLKIPAEDYERHMSSPNVLQLQMLGNIFSGIIDRFSPKNICVPGSAAGNGFEFLAGKNINSITGIDINPEYIELCRKRFNNLLPGLELHCADPAEVDFQNSSFDLIHAALIFEYVDVDLAVKKFARWLQPDGIISVVIQLPSDSSSTVSESGIQSVKILADVIKLIEPDKFKIIARESGLICVDEELMTLPTGKQFQKLIFKK